MHGCNPEIKVGNKIGLCTAAIRILGPGSSKLSNNKIRHIQWEKGNNTDKEVALEESKSLQVPVRDCQIKLLLS